MGENVQCPVCTLYLHAGMNLSDHLETHPKEQVIRALVQMTISGVGGSTAALASALKGESSTATDANKSLSEPEDKSLANDTTNDLNIISTGSTCSTSVSNSASNCSLSNQSTTSSQNSNNILNFSNTHIADHSGTETVAPVKLTLKSEETPTTSKEPPIKENSNDIFTNAHRTYSSSSNELANSNTNFAVFGNQRYQQHQRIVESQQLQLNTPSQMPPPPAPQGQHTEISRSILAPPLPQAMTSQSIPSGFHSIQTQQQLPHPPSSHHSSHLGNITNSHDRQPHIFAGQHQQTSPSHHHQQDMKVIYSSGLPPPPPLQLFSYQSPSQLQHHHQKPPPAYGTAISQIRSQNKHQVTGQLVSQHQHASTTTMTTHHDVVLHQQMHQQVMHHHNLRTHSAVQPPTPIATKHVFSKTSDVPQPTASTVSPQVTRHSSHQQQHLHKYFIAQQQHNLDVENQTRYNNSLNSNDNQNKAVKSLSVVSVPTTVVQPAVASASMVAVAASTLGRHTNSPFAALLAAAAGAPSPSNSSSVLRYAESPVAHYLERDNGDFIVQETPKHIVECVEKDNGEFSVIERIYQSPPSVLHIHDDADEDDDNDDADEDNKRDSNTSNIDSVDKITKEERKEVYVKSQLKKKVSSSPKKEDNIQCRNSTKMLIEAKVTNRKFIDNSSSDNEILDFVSISSDSDEEEFISHERKDHKNTAEKSKKTDPGTLPNTTTSPTSRIQLSTPSNIDAQIAPATSHSTSSSNPVVHQSGTRKKSSKNTITVLSDVQLNLNEYLDLVGNIIASSKVAAQRKTFTSIASIPLVKIEKEEPMDDYAISAAESIEQPLPPTPLKANKQETEDLTNNPSSSNCNNKPNNIRLIDHTEHDREEKKPQVLENIQGNNNVSTSSCIKNSSQVTSVIRMATTSQHTQQQLQQLISKSNENIHESSQVSAATENNNNISEAEDLSHNLKKTQTTGQSKILGHTTLVRKGPKKLVIKPKSANKELSPLIPSRVDDQQPSTSAKALEEYTKHMRVDETLIENEVQVKNEPITSITFENNNYNQQTCYSILEQHLTSKEPIMECKEEKPCIQESNLSTAIKEMKVENNVNDDARVLYDFATSKKVNTNNKSSTFPSPASLFAKEQRTEHTNYTRKISEGNNIHSEIDMSSYSSYSAVTSETNPSEEHIKTSATPTSSEHNGSSQVFSDFPFNYLYNSNNIEQENNEQVDIKNTQQFATLYQNTAADNNNTNRPMVLEDSSSSKNYSDYNQQQPPGASSQNQWFNNYQATVEVNAPSISSNPSNTNVNAECSSALDVNEVGKYLDLDECKREQNADIIGGSVGCKRYTVPPPPPSSSTSCSFTGAAENSMTGICSTVGTLNIRTDEKMPAKGEISEQESNCDIDNSWSQPIYGDISARFFKTTFPGIFQQDNVWSHEEYFTVQDLSASATSQTANVNSNKAKSFDFRLPSDGNNASGGGGNVSNSGMQIFSQNSNDNCNMDVMPSTSAKIRKRRKRISEDGKTTTTNLKRMQPTSTITSQEMMQSQNEVQAMDYNLQQHEQLPSTSSAILAGPSIAEMAAPPSPSVSVVSQLSQQQQQQRMRTKVYECGHCNAKYSKLKDRNAHMVDVHNYVRQNRRLVCISNGIAVPMTDAVDMATTNDINSGMLQAPNPDVSMSDFKQGIVKIENDNIHRDISGFEPINADLRAKKEEVDDDKQNLSLVPINSSTSTSQITLNAKPLNFQPLSLTTTTSKLTTLYRMLVTFNMTTLKQSQRMSEFDENLIKSSIFFCYICRQNFNSVKLYDAHLTEHPAECFTCGKKFQRWKNFSLHLKRHLGWKEFGCTVCDKKFVVRSALVEHTRMHSGLSPLKCKVCGKHFKRYSNLTQHRKRHSKQVIRRKEYVCYCGEVLPSKARFLWHKETHDSKPKCCPHCCDRFVHVNSLRRHIRLAHSNKFNYAEPMECPICKQIFAKASMKAHMATHSTDTQYDCAICNKSFSTKWNLKIHSWVHANRTAKPFKCEHCPKAFVREVDFKNHMNSHKQIKPYTCEVCGCKFIRKYNYMRHRREHHGNKKYTCDLCKKSFHRHYYLIEHRRIHTGERPFQCTICGKSSTTKTNHNKHLKIHHSRDPFTVEV